MSLLKLIQPEILLIAVACVSIMLGVSKRPFVRWLAPSMALAALVVIFVSQGLELFVHSGVDEFNTVRVGAMAHYVKLITAGIGAVLVLLNWPSNVAGTGEHSVDLGTEIPEFFGLMLLSLSGVFLVAGANDLVLLFLGIELASIPTYIMVSISRPLPVAQEAGVKYFFLGAMAAAVMLFGFSYLYGVTGHTKLDAIAAHFQNLPRDPATGRPIWTSWPLLAVVMLLAGFAFKIAAVPLHAYAGDVYQGAATPVTAFLAFTPKTTGFIALIKVFGAVAGAGWAVPEQVGKLLWVIALLTMTVGNVLALLQVNVKRMLAYSSVAHSGYMLVGLTALVSSTGNETVQRGALGGILFYLAAYGLSNAAAFGVLMLLPSRTADPHAAPRPHRAPHGKHVHQPAPPATTAETFEDLAGQGRHHVVLGLAMAIACFSLTGIPLTVGFLGKFYVIAPALQVGTRQMNWLVALMMLNAAIGAAYYLRVVATMFLRTDPHDGGLDESDIVKAHRLSRLVQRGAGPGLIAVGVSVGLSLIFGLVIRPTIRLTERATQAAVDEVRAAGGVNPAPTVSVAP